MTLSWIIVFGLLMSAIALVGGLCTLLPQRLLDRMLLPLVAFSAGSLLGGALFHMLPSAVDTLGNGAAVWVAVASGFLVFFCLEQFLHWHHCHASAHDHGRPLTWLILIADALHNFIGGLSVGAVFLIDVRLGVTAWFAAAAHEVPQELGDFGVLVHGGWSTRRALWFNFLSGLTFLVGGVLAWAASAAIDVTVLVPFGAGNFIYIAATDLIPEVKAPTTLRAGAVHLLFFLAALVLLLSLRVVLHTGP